MLHIEHCPKAVFAQARNAEIAGKYDKDVAAQCMCWVAKVTGEEVDTSGDMKGVFESLKDGYVLAQLLNHIKPGSIPARDVKRSPMQFKQMDLLAKFNLGLKAIGIPEHSLFATADLFEMQNMVQVITCLESIGRKCNSTPGCPVEGFGPKEAEANKRQFTEEQLAQGKNIIGLQMGSNKGANQSGQNFGKGRMIVD
ncbi:hypothetical protein ACOMHN_023585 [Nucella lapillus]